jgi:hypothetical protein
VFSEGLNSIEEIILEEEDYSIIDLKPLKKT